MICQTIRRAKNQSPIIRPCSFWLAVSSVFPHVGDGIRLHGGTIFELHGHAQGITDERTPKASDGPISP